MRRPKSDNLIPKSAPLAIVMFTMLFCTPAAHAVIQLSDLPSPTLQTLISFGSAGVGVAGIRFFDFTYASSASRSAAQVAVQPITPTSATDPVGLRFVSTWFAGNGNSMADVIIYKISTDTNQPIGAINLFSDGTAPIPVGGTFSSSSMTARTPANQLAGHILSTIDDGRLVPADTTGPDVDIDFASIMPQSSLTVTDAVTTVSTTGGLATTSIVENTFNLIPEPTLTGWIFLPGAVAGTTLLRRPSGFNRRSVKLAGRLQNASNPGCR